MIKAISMAFLPAILFYCIGMIGFVFVEFNYDYFNPLDWEKPVRFFWYAFSVCFGMIAFMVTDRD